ncbi:condensin complex subunit 2 isoform X2 [Diospyros lotus]|uniref:condensin complex subunit 2 isoform X2 n=1 Tax=Diospyros lotus TaxID=55363 RepID=UPI0022508A43|nr:condensin complex subunit 2 isoform X2 [Diospyros lotus]
MAETLSPNATALKQRTLMASRLQSPTSPFFLGSNDDNLERAQARAARAAAVRRKNATATSAASPPASDPCLDKQQILELFQNCIKLASENKINQKNTWDLSLIDHLCDIIKVEEEDDAETNFQKASCTLEAGVKIYSMRVDSVHSEAYKVLGGINRVGQENEQDDVVEDPSTSIGQEEGNSKKEQERKVSPLSTLESSFEALNVKKFDVAFAVDPLYHQTSAQFDEGGARGLLLNNLGVYGGCQVLFDSFEVPRKCMSSESQHQKLDTIDLSFAKEYIEQMVLNMHKKIEISPTLRHIVDQFDQSSRRPPDTFYSGQQSAEQVYEDDNGSNIELDGDTFNNSGTWAFDHDDQTSVVGDDSYTADPILPSYHEENEPSVLNEPDVDNRFDKVDGYLFLSLGLTSNQNAWAGPDHWKYRKTKDSEGPPRENGSPMTTKKPRNKKQAELDIDFTKALDNQILDVFAPPKNPSSLLVPANRPPCNTTLPEDCHYQPEELVKLFLVPNLMCLGKRARKSSEEWSQQRDDYGPLPSWDDENGFDGQYDDGGVHSDLEDSNTLVSQPRQVNKIEVQYDKTSKQVDVQALKGTLWDCLQESKQATIQEKEMVSFKNVLASFPKDCRAAATLNDISPHLCFICLLHLANEHGLRIHGCANLDDLSIHFPPNRGTFPSETV